MDNSGQVITYVVSGVRGKKIRGEFSPLFNWTDGCRFYTSQTCNKNALNTTRYPPSHIHPNTSPSTSTQHQQTLLTFSHTVFTYHHHISPQHPHIYFHKNHHKSLSHCIHIAFTFTIHKTTSQRLYVTSAPQSGILYHYLLASQDTD